MSAELLNTRKHMFIKLHRMLHTCRTLSTKQNKAYVYLNFSEVVLMDCEASCARYMRRMCIIYLIEIPYVVSPKVDRRRNDPSSCTMSPVYGRFSILASFSPQIIPQRSARADRTPATCVKVRGLSRDPRLPPLRLRIHGMN